MKQEKFFYLGLERERHHVVKASVAPAHVLLIFLAIILRVHDENIHAAQEADDPPLLALRVFERRLSHRVPFAT